MIKLLFAGLLIYCGQLSDSKVRELNSKIDLSQIEIVTNSNKISSCKEKEVELNNDIIVLNTEYDANYIQYTKWKYLEGSWLVQYQFWQTQVWLDTYNGAKSNAVFFNDKLKSNKSDLDFKNIEIGTNTEKIVEYTNSFNNVVKDKNKYIEDINNYKNISIVSYSTAAYLIFDYVWSKYKIKKVVPVVRMSSIEMEYKF